MRIMLVFPRTHHLTASPPVGLASLAATMRRQGHTVRVLDAQILGLSDRQVVDQAREFGPDVLGMGMIIGNHNRARELGRALKAALPATPLLIGGPQASPLPGLCLEETGADVCVVGEGERSLPALLGTLAARGPLHDVPGVAWLDDGQLRRSTPVEPLADLDALPFPEYDDAARVFSHPLPHQFLVRRFPVAPMITSRGCPHSCSFCATPGLLGRGWRARSAESVVEEMAWLVRRHGVREIHIQDDAFAVSRDRVLAICDGMLSQGLDLTWKFPNGVRIDRVDRELLRMMRQAGCYLVSFGLETTDQAVLDATGKQLDLACARQAVADAHAVGLEAVAFLVVGLPGETEETFRSTVRQVMELGFDYAHFSVLLPLPGSPMFEAWSPGEAALHGADWDRFRFYGGVAEQAEARQWHLWANRRFYLRPRTMAKSLGRIKARQLPGFARVIRSYFLW